MNPRPAPARATARRTRALALAAALAVGLPVLAAAAAPPAAAAVGDEVIAWVEVEDGAISGGPVFNSGDHGNFSGRGSYTFRETGMTSEMTVVAPEAGTYPLYVRYAAGPLGAEENVTRSMGLLTNGGARQQLSLPMTSYGDWETWRFVEGAVTLDQGTNTIALQCDRSIDFCRLNFDAIQVGGTAPDPCAAIETEEGYTSLFDGTFESFDGWRKAGLGGFGRQTDCTIESDRGRGATWYTQQQTAPYTLLVDWRRPESGDDSAVHVASTSRSSADAVGGLSVRIGADTGTIRTAAGVDHPADVADVAAAERPVGEWNTFRIEVTQTQVVVHLNGTKVNTYDSPTPLAASGFVGLENRSTTDEVRFRSIRLKSGIDPEVLPSTTAVTVAPAAVTVKHGTADVSVDVTSPGEVPTGDVELYVDDVLTSTVSLVDGRATGRLGPFPAVGTRSITARYLGDETTEPSSSEAATVTVRKATPKVTAQAAPRKIKAGVTRARLVVAVRTPGFTPTGTVRVRVDKLIGKKSYVGRLRNGRVTITLARFQRAGTAKATVTYLGNALATKASATVRIKVLRGGRR